MPILSPPEVVAPLRYMVIAPLVSRPLDFGEQRALLEEQAGTVWTHPDGRVQKIHPRTIRRWMTAYRLGGLVALAPKTRADHGHGRVSPDIIAQALALRVEDPHRSARQIITMLEWAGAMAPGSLCHSTLTYHFRKAGADAWLNPTRETRDGARAHRVKSETGHYSPRNAASGGVVPKSSQSRLLGPGNGRLQRSSQSGLATARAIPPPRTAVPPQIREILNNGSEP